jgi:hypothetical protein
LHKQHKLDIEHFTISEFNVEFGNRCFVFSLYIFEIFLDPKQAWSGFILKLMPFVNF